ncbi:MAG: hypothetical protein JWM62_167 [Frankiales bacterium]|jgi:hypothetical protein|nr:hypothetical protein [Frankiales bacterium]
MSVYVWRDRWDGPGGWSVGDLACAAEDPAGLREACRRAGLQLPSRPQRARATDDVVQIALAHVGRVLFLEGRDPHWRVLPSVDAAD